MSRPLLAGLVTAGLGIAALLLHPSAGLLSSAAAPPVATFLPTVLLVLGWGALLHRLFQRHRARDRQADLSPRAERLTEATDRLLVAAGLVVPVSVVCLYLSRTRPPPDVRPTRVAGPVQAPPAMPEDSGSHLPHLLGPILLALLLAGAAVAIVAALTQLRRRPARSRTGTEPQDGAEAGLDEQLAAAVELGRRALNGSDARAAVIACYAAMESSLADSGVARRIADSPTELLDRAVNRGTVHRADAGALTALFREARFSRHPMGTPELTRARTALEAIATQLTDRRSESEAAR
ncbi:DUF4129 domain-containing protein [Streptomyces tateyamensis]|uniref:DUF4129 domain-containing protein n=1 Tax=Streptomyces tateyamensis TaxID=565073 RepID=A0A2V4N1Z6_9ACTN|nr:DUF4129 domain-containing protein [Streptomyces tateyamensis]